MSPGFPGLCCKTFGSEGSCFGCSNSNFSWLPGMRYVLVTILHFCSPTNFLSGGGSFLSRDWNEQLEFHIHHAKEAARVVKILSLLNSKTGKVAKKAPRCLTAKQSAVIEVILSS